MYRYKPHYNGHYATIYEWEKLFICCIYDEKFSHSITEQIVGNKCTQGMQVIYTS